jgi:aromatic ring-opening dioxygenase catalytic subunit (LigB family)
MRMPLAYLPHGGGPWPFVDMGRFFEPAPKERLLSYLRSLRALSPEPPKALLVVSAHWEERVPTVMTSAQPPILYDYYGFPPEAYRITWPAPGDPALAERVRTLLAASGFETATDAQRGFDHGTFVPLKVAWPDADVPTIQLSLMHGLDPARHVALGKALAPLRDEGVLILGSGSSYHNMQGFGDPRSLDVSEAFDRWMRDTTALDEDARNTELARWSQAPAARLAHPREEHLLPLMVVAGAAGSDRGTVGYNDVVMGVRVSAIHFGAEH